MTASPDAGPTDEDVHDGDPGADGPPENHVRLVLPADPQYGRVARAAVQTLGLRLDLDARRVADLRLAVDETLILLLRPEGSAGEITIVFTIRPDRLEIDATSTSGRGQHWIDAGALARFDVLVRDTVDEHTVSESDDGRISVHLVKRIDRPPAGPQAG